MALPPKWYQFLVALFASLGSLLFGYDLGVVAQVIGSQSFNSKFNPKPNETGAVVSVFTGGAFFGAGIAGLMGDALGRRMTIMIGAMIFCLGGCFANRCSGTLLPLFWTSVCWIRCGNSCHDHSFVIPLHDS